MLVTVGTTYDQRDQLRRVRRAEKWGMQVTGHLYRLTSWYLELVIEVNLSVSDLSQEEESAEELFYKSAPAQ